MWTATSLWIASLGALAFYAALAARDIVAGGHIAAWLLGAIVLYVGAILLLCASYFTIAWIWRARRPREVRLDVRGTLRLWWNEYRTLLGSPPRLMLYRVLVRDPDPAPAHAPPVLLVHGVLCNAGVWLRLVRYLREARIGGLYSLSYGPPLESIETFAEQLARKIESIVAATGAPRVIVVAHSMGGLITRAYLRKHGPDRIARVVTIGTPHHGSMLAWFLPGASLTQMRPGNAWLAALNRERLDPALRFVSLWSWHDSMVAPQTSSELPGAVDVTIAGVGHNALLGDAGVFELVRSEIEAERRADASRETTPAIAPQDRCPV
ncbi:MAG TPA: alpha/beta fold hydrolase [Casimicrobiaceae bacterium]|nr:alpha/beta fold hydrolase [Casimicrobiaceae bacterium]